MPPAIALGVGVLVALAPAAVRLWVGRSLARSLDDAAIGERLLAAQKINVFALAFALAYLLFRGSAAAWLVPVSVLAYTAAAYPLRRALYEETWSLAGYMSFTLRLLATVSGFWILLAFMPVVGRAAGRWDLLVSLVLALVLLIWNARYVDILRAVMRARPVENAALRARFERLAAGCEIPTPIFEQVDMRGGVLANAIALASLRRSAVVFTDVLLDRLTADEAVAICAHELAHLEYFTPRRLRRLNAIAYALVALGAVLPAVLRVWEIPSILGWVIWASILLGALMWIARDRQKNETASDLRAVAITGDAEALVRALTKGYAIARMPRRLQPDVEKHATHPSLARRIRDIRESVGAPAATADVSATFNAASGPTSVTFGPDRLHWMEGDSATHSLNYTHLAELRVHAQRAGRPSLVAVESGGRRWEMPLAVADVAPVQAALDLVDGRLARTPAKADVWPRTARAVSGLLVVVTLPLGQFAAMVVALLAAVRPSAPLLAGAGAAGLTAAWLVLRDQGFGGDAFRIASGIVCATLSTGACLAAVAIRGRAQASSGRYIATIAMAAAAALSLLAFEAESIVRLHTWARSIAAASVFPLACAGALAFAQGRRGLLLSIPTALLGLGALAAGSPLVLDALEQDALLMPTRPPAWKTIDRPAFEEFTLPFPAAVLRLSPTGRHLAVGHAIESELGEGSMALHVGESGGRLTPMEADDFVFVDDEHFLAIDSRADGVILRQLRAAAPQRPVWEHHVRNVLDARLTVDRAAVRWQLVGEHAGQIVRVEGAIGGPEDRREVVGPRETALPAVAAAGDATIGVESDYEPGLAQRVGLWQLALLMPGTRMTTRIWRRTPTARVELGASQAETRCSADDLRPGRMACIAFDGTRSRIVALDARSGGASPVAVLSGRLFSYTRVSGGWLTGWHEGAALAIRLDTGEVVRMADGADEVVTSLSPADSVMGAVIYRESASLVRLYAMDD
jgi:Zn-dependent protease with chaperone function